MLQQLRAIRITNKGEVVQQLLEQNLPSPKFPSFDIPPRPKVRGFLNASLGCTT